MAKQNAETITNENQAPAQLGMCCGTPLVATFVFSGAEYYCVRCGSTYGMFDVPRKIETPALREERGRNIEAFDSVAKGAIARNSLHHDCEKCNAPGKPDGYHHQHATSEQAAASEEAYAALKGGIVDKFPELRPGQD